MTVEKSCKNQTVWVTVKLQKLFFYDMICTFYPPAETDPSASHCVSKNVTPPRMQNINVFPSKDNYFVREKYLLCPKKHFLKKVLFRQKNTFSQKKYFFTKEVTFLPPHKKKNCLKKYFLLPLKVLFLPQKINVLPPKKVVFSDSTDITDI